MLPGVIVTHHFKEEQEGQITILQLEIAWLFLQALLLHLAAAELPLRFPLPHAAFPFPALPSQIFLPQAS